MVVPCRSLRFMSSLESWFPKEGPASLPSLFSWIFECVRCCMQYLSYFSASSQVWQCSHRDCWLSRVWIESSIPGSPRPHTCSVPVVSLVVCMKPSITMIGAFTSLLTPQPAEHCNQHFTDCLQHCNSPLTRFPDSIPIPPQSIFHSAARMILQKQKSNSIKWCSCYGKYYGGSSKI